VFYEIWKAWSLALDEETDQLYELNKQQEDEIKEFKTRLQAKENTSSDFIYFERSRSQKIPDSSLFTDEKNFMSELCLDESISESQSWIVLDL